MKMLQKIAENIIRASFHLSVWIIEQFHNVKIYENKVELLLKMPNGTLGNDIGKSLRENNLRLVPRYESHDLKHILLGYGMNPIDEIRMQAFMIGNKNYSISVFAIFIFGALILPDHWKVFYKDFKRGRESVPIKTWTIEEYAHYQTSLLKAIIFNEISTN
jgi:ubiquinone biosynthesis protein Coq4